MLTHIKLGGKERPILFGNAAFKMLRQRSGITMGKFLEDLAGGDPTYISDITFCALRVGEIAQKEKDVEDYNEMDVAVWMDLYEGGAEAFLKMILEALPKPEAGEGGTQPGEAKMEAKIGTGTN